MATVPTQQTSPAPAGHPPTLTRALIRAIIRAFAWLVIVTAVMVFGASAWFYWRAHACLPQLDGTIQVPGLKERVQVRRDARGVPHLKAASLEDLMFAQGYV